MKLYLKFFAVTFFVSTALADRAQVNSPQLQPIDTYHSGIFVGSLYKQPIPHSNRSILIADLRGTYQDMGKEYGALLSRNGALLSNNNDPNYDLLISFYNNLTNLPLEHNFLMSSLYKYILLPQSKKHIPQQEMDMINGAAETSGLTPDQLILLDKTLFFTFLSHLSTAELASAFPGVGMISENSVVPPGCSTLAVWGDYTASGDLLVGRNFDWAKSAYPAFNSPNSPNMLLVTIYHPTDAQGTRIANTVATLGYPGWFSTITGMNDKHLFLELNSGWYSSYAINMIYDNSPQSYMDVLTNTLFTANTYADLYTAIQNSSPDMGYMIFGADGVSKKAFFAEMIPDTIPGMKFLPKTVWMRENSSKSHYAADAEIKDQNVLLATNTFRLDDGKKQVWTTKTLIPWPYPDASKDPNDSFPMLRYDNLLHLAQANKGKLDVEAMEKIFEKSINGSGENAGATEYQYDPKGTKEISNTFYTVIVDFAQNVWHVRQTGITKGQGGEDWVDIDLAQFFK